MCVPDSKNLLLSEIEDLLTQFKATLCEDTPVDELALYLFRCIEIYENYIHASNIECDLQLHEMKLVCDMLDNIRSIKEARNNASKSK